MKDIEKQDGFVMLPRWLVEANRLTGKELAFCLILAYHRNSHTKLCCPNIPTLCSELNLWNKAVFKIRKKMVKLGLINYTAGSGRKRYARYDLNWLDGSKEDIKRLKEVLKTKEVESNHIKRSRVKSHQRSRVKSHHKVESNHTTNNKEYNNNELQQQQEETRERKKNKTLDKKKLATAASSLLNSLKEKTLETLKDYGLSEDTITDLIKNCPAKNKDKYFSQWITHIKTSNIKKPAGFLITMVNKRENPPQKEAKKLSPARKQLIEIKNADRLLKQAKIELGRLCSKEKVLSWLERLPESYHSKLKQHLDQVYPVKHSYGEAKEEWDKKKWGWRIGKNE